MALSYQKLISFDLLRDLDESIRRDSRFDCIVNFMDICQKIQAADGFIGDLPAYPMSTTKIKRNELVSAIGSTLLLEGISVDKDEINTAIEGRNEEDDNQEIKRKKEQEVINSQNVYDYIQSVVADQKNNGEFVYELSHIYEIHKLFTENIEYPGNTPGVFRNTRAYFGYPPKPSLCGSYSDIYVAMKEFIIWLNSKGQNIFNSNIISKAIMAHYYLAEIHPFGDGNGRTARAVEAMVLRVNEVNPYCFWSLANFWSANRNEYIENLGSVRQTCDPYNFLKWGLEGYLEEILRIKDLVLKKVKQLMFRDYVAWLRGTNKERPAEKRINGRMFNVLMMLSDLGKIPLGKLRTDSFYKALYSGVSNATQSRDFSRITRSMKLAALSSKQGEEYIEPNYEIFKDLEYKV